MQGVDAASETLNLIINKSAKQLYDNYINLKAPLHVSKKQILQLKQLCSQQFVNYNKLKVLNPQKQPQQVARDSMGFKQVALQKKQCIQSIIPIKLNKTQRINKSNSQKCTNKLQKKNRILSPSMKNKHQSQFIKLNSPDIIQYQQQTTQQKQLRRTKSNQIQKINALKKQKQIEVASKKAQFQNLQQQYNKYIKQCIKTTFDFNGVIIPTVKRHIDRSIVSLKSSVLQIPKLKKSNKKITNTRKTSYLPRQYTTQNMFTSLLYQITLNNKTEQQKAFDSNQAYNNYNQIQTSHSKLIDLKQGVHLIQPVNKIHLKNKTIKRNLFQNRKSTFKHFARQKEQNNEQHSKENSKYNDNKQEQTYQQFIESKTQIGSHFSTAYKMDITNRFRSTQKSYINPFARRHKSLNHSKTFYNNGNQKINITNDSIDILFS